MFTCHIVQPLTFKCNNRCRCRAMTRGLVSSPHPLPICFHIQFHTIGFVVYHLWHLVTSISLGHCSLVVLGFFSKKELDNTCPSRGSWVALRSHTNVVNPFLKHSHLALHFSLYSTPAELEQPECHDNPTPDLPARCHPPLEGESQGSKFDVTFFLLPIWS